VTWYCSGNQWPVQESSGGPPSGTEDGWRVWTLLGEAHCELHWAFFLGKCSIVYAEIMNSPRSMLLLGALAMTAWAQTPGSPVPQFEDYPATRTFKGKPAEPILGTPEQRRYRTRIRDGAMKGSDVWSGSWRNPITNGGPNFAGHYFVIRWGCGSQCVMMAIVDAETGNVYEPPLAEKGFLHVPLDHLSEMEVDLRLDSNLIVLRNACRDFKDRTSCGVYYFDWNGNRFALVKFKMVDTSKAPR